MADIESLELRVVGNSTGAIQSIESLITTLDRLEGATQNGCGLVALEASIKKLSKAADSLSDTTVSRLTSLAGALSALSKVGNFKISSSIANQITAIGTAVSTHSGVDYSKLQDLAASLRPMENLGKSNLGSFITPLKKLPEVIAELNKLDMTSFASKIREVAAAVKPLADEMQRVANGFATFPVKIQKFSQASANIPRVNNLSAMSFARLGAKMLTMTYALRRVARVLAMWINESNSYVENLNLFTVAMGEYAESALEYAQNVSDVMGIDVSDWIRNQGVFMTLASGFGVATDRAATMSKQLTQLGYDLSSFYNISVEEAMRKLQSGIAGELEPLRRLGYDLSMAKLEATALSLGIDKAVSSMTQAEKAELRYYAVMTQIPKVQGDMARTLEAPANQLRVFKAQLNMATRSLGNIFIPALNAMLPYAIAATKVIRYLADAIASLFGFVLPEIDYSNLEGLGSSAGDASDELGEAAEEAGKLKKMLLGIDELNVMSDSSSDDDVLGSGFDFELPTYDFIDEAVTSRVDEIVEKFKDWLGITGDITTWADLFDTKLGDILITVGAIAAGFAAWKISAATVTALGTIKSLLGTGGVISLSIVGLTLFLDDLTKLKDYLEDYVKNGETFSNVSGMISEFAGLIGDAMLILGRLKTAGALKAIQGVGEIVSTIADMVDEGVDFDNVTDLLDGLTDVAIGIGLLTKQIKLVGTSLALKGFLGIIEELGENWDAIREGDWSGVDKATLVVSAIEAITGIVVAFGLFNKVKTGANISKTAANLSEVASATTAVAKTTSTLTTKLTTLLKNLGLGIAIIAEVAVAAGLFVGAIWGIGKLLEQVGKAWRPVLENGETVTAAILIGTALLTGIGTATGALGTAGSSICSYLGIGIAMLAEIGAATALFIAEIWAIGWSLDEVGKAWQPVLDNGRTIELAILQGTVLLVAVGTAAGLLGLATTATGGMLPAAIGLGIAILAEMGVAVGLFVAEIWAIGWGLDEIGEAWGPVLENGETIEDAILTGTILLVAVASAAAALGVATVATGGVALPLAIGAGTLMLFELGIAATSFINNIAAIGDKLDEMNDAWNPLLRERDGYERAICEGTTLLVGIGSATASLGAASIASIGLLPLAISCGTDMLDMLSDGFKKFVTGLVKVTNKLNDELSPSLRTLSGKLPGLKTDMADFTTFMVGFVSEIYNYSVNSMLGSVASIVQSVVGFFSADPFGTMTDALEDQEEPVEDLVDELKYMVKMVGKAKDLLSEFNDAMDGLSSAAGSGSNGTSDINYSIKIGIGLKKDGWSTMKDWLGGLKYKLEFKLPSIGINWGTKNYLGFTISYPESFFTYAQGGFPDVGEMFIAREAGPELVGTIGNRTAVANNDQIVDSVSKGVYKAVVQAMSQSGGSQTVEAKVNDKVLFEVVVNRNRQEMMRTGYNPMLGGA